MPRLFTGLEIPEALSSRLAMVRGRLSGARWIDPENYHVTLRFAGDIDERQAQDFAAALDAIDFDPFPLTLDGLGSFGSRKPRSIWARVVPSDALTALHSANERAARQVGLEPESRNFIPHVTLARLKGAKADVVADFMESQGGPFAETFEVKRFVLYSSRPGRGGGPYVVEEEYPAPHDPQDDDGLHYADQ